MVTRLTSYTKQRYVTNSGEDSGDIVFRNGDTVFLMDTQQEIIYSEDDNQWYPVPTAGGGGGGVPISNAQYLEFTPATTASSSNYLTIQLTPVSSGNHYWLAVWAKEFPAVSEEQTPALLAIKMDMAIGNVGSILRTNGTIGSDQNEISFDPASGVLTAGGSYGVFPAGATYCVLLVEV